MADDEVQNYQPDEMIRGLPLQEKVPVVALKKLLDEHYQLDKQENEQIEAVNSKYLKLQQPLALRASEIVKGGALTADEVAYVKNWLKDGEQLDSLAKGSKVKHFWSKVLRNSKLAELITEEDIPALNALEDVRFSVESDTVIRLTFEFSDNPNFGACIINRELLLEGGEVVESRGDLIKWKSGHSLTHEQKTVTNKKTGQKKQTQGDQRPSMFHFFRNDTNKTEDEQKHLAIQKTIVNELTHDIVPYSLQFYLGVADGEFGVDEQQDDDDEENGDEDEGEDEDSQDEDKPRKKQHRS